MTTPPVDAQSPRWHVHVDAGGTFTDLIVQAPESVQPKRVTKVLSGPNAVCRGLEELFGRPDGWPPLAVRMGTTVGTNALLEGQGARVLWVTNRGFGDMLQIGDQTRRDLFALQIQANARCVAATLEVDCRCDAQGRAVRSLSEPTRADTLRALERAHAQGLQSVAIAFVHAHVNPEHELAVAALARKAGFGSISCSHEVAHSSGWLARAQTTVVDAYLTPILRRATEGLAADLRARCVAEPTLLFMRSNGGLVGASQFRGRDCVMSGPAGGVVAVARVAKALGLEQVIGFDMGGTSTDVCRYAGEFERSYDTQIGGHRIRVPMLELHTVAAGGGSIYAAASGRLTVGPRSAGSKPGPLCYGRANANALTVTDLNVHLGRVAQHHFPFALRQDPVRAALQALDAQLPVRLGDEALAAGGLEIANEAMANAIRQITVARGHDPKAHTLIAFGGAGGQHACAVAAKLGIKRVVQPPLGGVLSAWGIGGAQRTWESQRDLSADAWVLGQQTQGLAGCDAAFEQLDRELQGARSADASSEDGSSEAAPTLRRYALGLAYAGSHTVVRVQVELPIRAQRAGEIRGAFEGVHLARFGYVRDGHPIELRSAHASWSEGPPRSSSHSGDEDSPAKIEATHSNNAAPKRQRMFADGGWHEGPVYERHLLDPGHTIEGPCLVASPTGNLVLEPGWTARAIPLRGDEHALVAEDRRTAAKVDSPVLGAGTTADPIELELYLRRFDSISAEMGAVLERTALSTNIRDRHDFSCAVFDAEGELVANAPHIPVHLGAMAQTVRAVAQAHPNAHAGDAFASNDPAAGGSHLPDITVVSPVFGPDGVRRFFVASRGHHADIGGITPGSMPPHSSSLKQEGVVLRALPIVRAGTWAEAELRAQLGAGPYPCRKPNEVLADLRAQLAANRRGEALLLEMLAQQGSAACVAYMAHIQAHAATCVRATIVSKADGTYSFADQLDDGTPMAVDIEVRGEHMVIDLRACGDQHAGNLNAPRAVAIAAVLYVLRCWVGRPIPLNAGCLDSVDVRLRPGSILDPGPDAAVVAGNVETSQRLVDILLGALGLAAASQGTMNNLSFGTSSWGYYETLGGGAGAGPDFAGAHAVHTHMTNTRLTDIEELEAHHPVRLLECSIRRGSGGAGAYPGGAGMIRSYEFLAPMQVSLIAERRRCVPFGLAGGHPGAPAIQSLDGVALPGRCTFEVQAGQVFHVETPGGGGYGAESGEG